MLTAQDQNVLVNSLAWERLSLISLTILIHADFHIRILIVTKTRAYVQGAAATFAVREDTVHRFTGGKAFAVNLNYIHDSQRAYRLADAC